MRRDIDWTNLGSGVTKKLDHYIADMVHRIFNKELNDELKLIKSKLVARMREKEYIYADVDNINNVEKLYKDYNKVSPIELVDEDIINTLYFSEKVALAIHYIGFIIFVFGSLKSYNEYIIKEEDNIIRRHLSNRTYCLVRPKKLNIGIRRYERVLEKRFQKEYYIVKQLSYNTYLIKHTRCGLKFPMQCYLIAKFKECPMCREYRNKRDKFMVYNQVSSKQLSDKK